MKTLFISLIIFSISNVSFAETLSFPMVWKQINSDSVAQESSRLQTESLNASKERTERHWFPKVYLDIKGYQTNDPGSSFFALLEQRSLQQNDFNPDAINHPNTNFYTRGALGLDLALFEGGANTSHVDLLKYAVQAQENTTSQIQVDQYSQIGFSYGSIGILTKQITKIHDLSSVIERFLKNYQLGNKSNPVGYSGLLGMKSLANRLTGLMSQYQAQSKSYYAVINELGLKNSNWTPEDQNTLHFVERYFLIKNITTDSNVSYKVQSLKDNIKVSEQTAQMEKARFLPKVGAFAEGYQFNGNRTAANGYMAGVYLQWNLFNPADYGLFKEAKLKSLAVSKSAEAFEQQERAEKLALLESIKSLQENITLLNDSYTILLEQSKITETLFKNGSINALQIVEILSRRTDLIVQQAEAELGLVKVATQVITKQKFLIPNHFLAEPKE
ncbi:MAG: TolC family protein [Pseudobdellovibrio sp.]